MIAKLIFLKMFKIRYTGKINKFPAITARSLSRGPAPARPSVRLAPHFFCWEFIYFAGEFIYFAGKYFPGPAAANKLPTKNIQSPAK